MVSIESSYSIISNVVQTKCLFHILVSSFILGQQLESHNLTILSSGKFPIKTYNEGNVEWICS